MPFFVGRQSTSHQVIYQPILKQGFIHLTGGVLCISSKAETQLFVNVAALESHIWNPQDVVNPHFDGKRESAFL